ncbi:MAG: hypothetical protein HGA45_30280 [Chloroflexales bacterium]|nr:hypothetical protein [Chloroflexales bacterium]
MSQPENDDTKSHQPQNDLASELRELGQQLETAVRSTIQSEKAKQVQQDLSSGMKEIGTQLQAAFKAIQENPNVRQLVERGEHAVSQAQQSKAAQDFQETLARGIAQLNDQLASFVTRMRQPDSPAPSDEPPATGETTRLDPDQK